jgi:aerobic carbon-monoxide dehydrogenase medium subunit
MIPASFDYFRPETLDQAIALLGQHGEDAKLLAGGHSLIPAMKLRLAQPKVLIDLAHIGDLKYIREAGNRIAIGAMATHYQIESSSLLGSKCPLLPEAAVHLGDLQVRNKGTIGGSLVHDDPGADWPAVVLALDAEFELAGPGGRRTVLASNFFVDMLQTAARADEVLCEIRVPVTGNSVAYVKTRQKASGFALCGAAVVIAQGSVAIGITGVAPKPYRARAAEDELRGKPLNSQTISAAARRAADGVEPLGDIHASPEYRANLARVNTRRALEAALAREG